MAAQHSGGHAADAMRMTSPKVANVVVASK